MVYGIMRVCQNVSINSMQVVNRITEEVENYKNGNVILSGGIPFSAYKLIRRINLYKNHHYPTGKRDSVGNYKYWLDVITPRVDGDVKNIDFDTKDITLVSDSPEDNTRLLLANARLKDYLRESGEAAKLNEAVERNTEWGNVVWKKVKGGYAIKELSKVMVLNQIAETLDDSDVIEWDVMTPIDMRAKTSIWKNVEKLLNLAKKDEDKTTPEIFVYERNGEITTREFFEAQGTEGGDDKTYILAKVIVGGVEEGAPSEVLFTEEIKDKKNIYKESHRGKFSGKWLRVGMYEALFDVQTRANEIGNQIARGLEHAAHTIFRSSDRIVAQNILTDLQNGDIIKSADLQQVVTRMDGFDQLIADWNRIMEIADKIANSSEVVIGESLPSGTPFKLADRLDMNANKLFDFLREKLSISFQEVVEDWILPDLLRDLKAKTVLKLTADGGFLGRYYETVIDSWYLSNLLAFGPHTPEIAQALKEKKMQELLKNKETSVQLQKDMWDDFKPRATVVIVGEQVNIISEVETLKNMALASQDPIRREAIIELIGVKKGIDIEKLPKTPPQPVQEPQRASQPQRVEQT